MTDTDKPQIVEESEEEDSPETGWVEEPYALEGRHTHGRYTKVGHSAIDEWSN